MFSVFASMRAQSLAQMHGVFCQLGRIRLKEDHTLNASFASEKEKNEMKASTRTMNKVLITLSIVALAFCLVGCAPSAKTSSSSPATSTSSSSSDSGSIALPETESTSDQEIAVFGAPKVVDIKNGSGTETIGQCAVFNASSGTCTPDNLASWYKDDVKPNKHNWDVILYTDKKGYGVYANAGTGMVEVNVKLESESDGSYMVADSSDATTYTYDSSTESLKKVGK